MKGNKRLILSALTAVTLQAPLLAEGPIFDGSARPTWQASLLAQPVKRSASGRKKPVPQQSVEARQSVSARQTPTPASKGRDGPAAKKGAVVRLPDGITLNTKTAIDRGLAYLARRQDRQGSWSNQGRYGSYPVAMTSLAGLALLMDGNTTTQGRYAPQVDRAVRFLLRNTKPNGLISGPQHEGRPMYGQGFSMLFLSQLYGMTEDATRAAQMHDVLARAVQLTAGAQNSAGGWYYTPDSGADEGSVTVTQVQALRSCRNVGLAVPKAVIDDAMTYLANSQNSNGGIRYSMRQPRGNSRPAITAAAVCCWYNGGEYDNPRAKKALKYCKPLIKPRGSQGGHDYYAHLYFAQALYISDDPFWDGYFAKRRDFLLTEQRTDGSWWGDGVGDVYGTALALIVLQLPYNQLPIMQR